MPHPNTLEEITPVSTDGLRSAGRFSILALLIYSPFVGSLIYAINERETLEQTSKMMGGGFSLPLIIGLVSVVGVILAVITIAIVASALFEYFKQRSEVMALTEFKNTMSTTVDPVSTLSAQAHEEIKQANVSIDKIKESLLLHTSHNQDPDESQNVVDHTTHYPKLFTSQDPETRQDTDLASFNSCLNNA